MRFIEIDISFLRECFTFQEDGTLIWRKRPLAHFASEASCSRWNRRLAGKPAGSRLSNGYVYVGLRYHGRDFLLLVQRVIFALANGEWPKDELDHRNGKPTDNRLVNLRLANRSGQMQNALYRNNTSGFTGISLDKRDMRWSAYITIYRRRISLGRFGSAKEAHAAYLAAKLHYHTFQPIPRQM